ncbi:hypothetical protein [Dokdonella sp.]|uniref:hypothetical protein n=1 Tax=Dokdonella sp. TaxID=2291710 RepID=UPI003F7DE30D
MLLEMLPDAVEYAMLVGGQAQVVHGANVRTLVRIRKTHAHLAWVASAHHTEHCVQSPMR